MKRTQTRHTSAPGFSWESLRHTRFNQSIVSYLFETLQGFSRIKMQLFKSNHHVPPTTNCVLPTAPNGALSSSMFSEALTENKSERHFFRKVVARNWKNRVFTFIRRRYQCYSSVVICVFAPRRWLLCCRERPLDTSRLATENPVTECPLTW